MQQPIVEGESPLIQINWAKIWRGIKAIVAGIIWLVKKIVQLIVKLMTLIALLIYKIYLGVSYIVKKIFSFLKKFSQKSIRGGWILLMILIFLIISGVVATKVYSKVKSDQEQLQFYQNSMQSAGETVNGLREDIIDLKEKILQKDKALKIKAEIDKKLAQKQYIAINRATADEKLPGEVKQIINKYSSQYGISDVGLMKCTVFNESGGRSEAIGDSGLAVGACQYHLATFLGHRRQMGLPVVDLRADTDACIQAMSFSVSRGGIGNWTAAKKCMI